MESPISRLQIGDRVIYCLMETNVNEGITVQKRTYHLMEVIAIQLSKFSGRDRITIDSKYLASKELSNEDYKYKWWFNKGEALRSELKMLQEQTTNLVEELSKIN